MLTTTNLVDPGFDGHVESTQSSRPDDAVGVKTVSRLEILDSGLEFAAVSGRRRQCRSSWQIAGDH
jgi:hypothetical protein